MDGIAPAAVIPTPMKGKKKRIKRVTRGGKHSPASIVCTSHPSSRGHDATIEWGLVLSLLVMTLYLYGFFESMMALPDVPHSVGRHLGENLNLAKDEHVGNADLPTTDALPVRSNRFESRASKQLADAFDKSPSVHVPEHKWPHSVTNEDGGFETIIHPGDRKTTMSVPKFWSPPIHNGGLMTRATAMKVGSCNEPDPKTGSIARGDECPPDERTIYFAIASYRDFQCRFTVESAFKRAKNPLRIRVGECS